MYSEAILAKVLYICENQNKVAFQILFPDGTLQQIILPVKDVIKFKEGSNVELVLNAT